VRFGGELFGGDVIGCLGFQHTLPTGVVGGIEAAQELCSLRRTKALIISEANGNLQAVQILPAHTRTASMVRYLGINVEDARKIAEHTECNGRAGHTFTFRRLAFAGWPPPADRYAIDSSR